MVFLCILHCLECNECSHITRYMGGFFFPPRLMFWARKQIKKILIDIVRLALKKQTAELLGCAYFVDVENY